MDVCNLGPVSLQGTQADEGQDEEQNGKLGPGLTGGSGGFTQAHGTETDR